MVQLNGINDSGAIVGQYNLNHIGIAAAPTGFLYQNGTFTTISDPGANVNFGTTANGISNDGTIVGNYYQSFSSDQAFKLSNGTYTTISNQGYGNVSANGIGLTTGAIVGDVFSCCNGIGYVQQGTSSTSTPNFNSSAYGSNTFASYSFHTGINSSGDIVGGYGGQYDGFGGKFGFYYNGTSFSVIDPVSPFQSQTTSVNGINNAGEMVGGYTTSSGNTYGYLDVNGIFTTLSVPGASTTWAQGINNLGDIVGYYTNSSGTFGFLATPNTVPPISGTPEPSTLVLFGTGIFLMGYLTLRNRRPTLKV